MMRLLCSAFLLFAAIAAASAPEVPPMDVAPPQAPPSEPEAPDTSSLSVFPSTQAQHDTQPVCVYQSRPWYPEALRKKGTEGQVTVDFVIGPNGEVVLAHAVGATQEELGWSAVACVSKWEFKPGLKNGKPVYVHMQVPIIFTLGKGK